MDLNNSIIFGGIDSADYGIYVAGNSVFNSPERDVTMIDIPGRNGQLALDNGRFMNIEITYNAFVTGDHPNDIKDNIRGYRNAIGSLKGYQRLEDTFHTDEFRQAIFRNGIEVEPTIYQTGGYFDITFDCKPQRWLTITEQRMDATLPGTGISTLTPFPAKPLIIIRYTRGATLGMFEFCHQYTVNVQLADLQQTPNSLGECELFIDCELMDAYEYETFTDQNENTGQILSANSAVTCPNGFPVIEPTYDSDPFCTDYITVPNSGNIKGVYFIGRYWRI